MPDRIPDRFRLDRRPPLFTPELGQGVGQGLLSWSGSHDVPNDNAGPVPYDGVEWFKVGVVFAEFDAEQDMLTFTRPGVVVVSTEVEWAADTVGYRYAYHLWDQSFTRGDADNDPTARGTIIQNFSRAYDVVEGTQFELGLYQNSGDVLSAFYTTTWDYRSLT